MGQISGTLLYPSFSFSSLLTSIPELRYRVNMIQYFLHQARVTQQLAARSQASALAEIQRLSRTAKFLRRYLPPGQLIGPRFDTAQTLNALADYDDKALQRALDLMAADAEYTQGGFPSSPRRAPPPESPIAGPSQPRSRHRAPPEAKFEIQDDDPEYEEEEDEPEPSGKGKGKAKAQPKSSKRK